MNKYIKFLLPILILAIGSGGYIYILKSQPTKQAVTIEEQIWHVAIKTVTPSTHSPIVTLYGRVESPRTSTLRTPSQTLNLNAQVTAVTILEGEIVKKGKVLIRLDKRDSRLNLKQRHADIVDIDAQLLLEKHNHAHNLKALTYETNLQKLMQTSVKRLQKLKKQNLTSQAALDEAQQAVERQMLVVIQRKLAIKNHKSRRAQLQAKHTRATAQRALARLELERTKIIAPFSGRIADVNVAVGDSVRSGDVLLSLYDNTDVEIRAQIPSRYQETVLKALHAKKQLHATVHGKQIRLKLNRVSGQINPDSGGIDGLLSVLNGDLRLGEFISLSLRLPEQKNVVALPFESVYRLNHIYKLVDGRMTLLKIERIGENQESQLLVRSPELQEGDQVILTQLPNAMEGLKVQIGESP
ncbi:MAG: efflux RND transporter periplasmic adaptor subunit [Thiomargarita sp.]|nr:efflux RND transporter periplasmic adaptor subunit [Thiomargarita sp.]